MTEEVYEKKSLLQRLGLSTPESTREARRGVALLGGIWRQPHYSVGYAASAKTLFAAYEVKPTKDLIPPVLYMIRHAVELALKDILWGHHQNQLDQADLDHLNQVASLATPLSETQKQKLGRCHDLQWLLDQLHEAVPEYVTRPVADFVLEIGALERDSPERFRYREVRVRANGKAVEQQSFPEPVEIDLSSLITKLDRFMKQTAHLGAGPGEDCSALQDLGYCAEALAQQLYAHGGYG